MTTLKTFCTWKISDENAVRMHVHSYRRCLCDKLNPMFPWKSIKRLKSDYLNKLEQNSQQNMECRLLVPCLMNEIVYQVQFLVDVHSIWSVANDRPKIGLKLFTIKINTYILVHNYDLFTSQLLTTCSTASRPRRTWLCFFYHYLF